MPKEISSSPISELKLDPLKLAQIRRFSRINTYIRQHQGQLDLYSPTLEKEIHELHRKAVLFADKVI